MSYFINIYNIFKNHIYYVSIPNINLVSNYPFFSIIQSISSSDAIFTSIVEQKNYQIRYQVSSSHFHSICEFDKGFLKVFNNKLELFILVK